MKALQDVLITQALPSVKEETVPPLHMAPFVRSEERRFLESRTEHTLNAIARSGELPDTGVPGMDDSHIELLVYWV